MLVSEQCVNEAVCNVTQVVCNSVMIDSSSESKEELLFLTTMVVGFELA